MRRPPAPGETAAPELSPPNPTPGGLVVFPVLGMPEIVPGDVLATLIAERAELADGDVVVITQKAVSKAEGRLVTLSPGGDGDGDDSDAANAAGRRQLVEEEAVRVLRRRGDLVITETRHGFVCANAGVDLSNVALGQACLLPVDPDRSARRVRDGLRALAGCKVGVVVSDTFGRPWRLGVTDVAIGTAGIAAVVDLRGQTDAQGRPLVATEVCVADELAGAAELVMGKARGLPAAVVRGVDPTWLRESSVASEIVRPHGEDLFR